MTHDFTAQEAETRKVFAELQANHRLPDIADMDYFFVPAKTGADWRTLADALTHEGFSCEWIAAEKDDEAPYLVATLPDQMISATAIWTTEALATRIALDHGFDPDGWGLMGDEGA